MNHRPDITGGEKIHDGVLASLDVDFDLGETGNIGKCIPVARIVIFCRRYQALARDRRDRCLRQFVDVGRRFVAIVDAAEFNRIFRGLCQTHARAAPLAKNPFVGDLILLWSSAELFGSDLLKLLLGVHRSSIRGPRHRVRGLAAAGNTSKWKVLCRVAPNDFAFFPRHAKNFCARAVNVDHRLGSQVADARLETDTAIWPDDEQPVEPNRAANVTAQRDTNAANLCADSFRSARNPLAPSKLLRAAVERFFEKCAGGILPLALYRRSEWRFALGAVDAANGYLVDSQLARGLRYDRLHDHDPLQPARGTLRTARRRVRQNRHAPPAHGLGLIQQRDDAARGRSVAH